MARELGARNVTAFPMQSLNGTYGVSIPLKNCVSINVKNNYDEREYYSDGGIENSLSTLKSADVELEMSSNMSLSTLSEITALDYAHGKLTTGTSSSAPRIALAYEIIMDDETTRKRVLYNVTLRKEESNNETESEGETFTLIGKAVPIEYMSKQYVDLTMGEIDIENGEEVEEKIKIKAEYDSFFTKVVMPGASA